VAQPDAVRQIKVTEGDVILIPVPKAGYGVAKVLFASRRARNVILLGIYKLNVEEVKMPEKLPQAFEPPLVYTGSQGIGEGCLWPRVGNVGITDAERAMSLRIVGQHVYLGDECLRAATLEDEETLPDMGVAGRLFVEEQVARVVASRRS
jgi:hypothetical protein